jgi:hypothetical protein
MKKQPEQRMGINARMDESIVMEKEGPKKGKTWGVLIDSDLIDGETCPKGGLLGRYERQIL